MDGEAHQPKIDFEQISRRHPREVYRLVRRFVDDPEDALDLAQEVFLRAFLHREEFRSESAFTTWLYRIAVNLCHDEQRKRARQQAREIFAPEALEISSGAPSVLETLVARERAEHLEQLIQALPPDEYVAIVLHYYAGLPQRQVAEVIDASLSAVESRLRRARSRLEQWLQCDEDLSPLAHEDGNRFLTVGRILQHLRDWEASLPYCEKAVSLMPDDVSALCALGGAYWHGNDLDGAWEMAQHALRVDPDAGQAHNLCGIIHGQRGERQDAIASFQRAASDDRWTGRARAYGNLGTTFAFARQWQSAVTALEEAISLDPNYGMAYSHLGNIHLELGRLPEALRCQDKAVSLDPPYFQGHFNRGAVLEAMGRIDEAIASYRRASQLAPWWIDAHAALGLLLHAQGLRGEAEGHFDVALRTVGGGACGTCFKGRIYLAKGDHPAAEALLDEAAREASGWAEPMLWLAQLHQDRGNLAAAVRAAQEAVRREPDSAEAAMRLGALEEQGRQ